MRGAKREASFSEGRLLGRLQREVFRLTSDRLTNNIRTPPSWLGGSKSCSRWMRPGPSGLRTNGAPRYGGLSVTILATRSYYTPKRSVREVKIAAIHRRPFRKMLPRQWNVFRTLTQRRNHDRKQMQPVLEVFPKFSVVHPGREQPTSAPESFRGCHGNSVRFNLPT